VGRIVMGIAGVCLAVAWPSAWNEAFAQSEPSQMFPSRPVRLIVPFAPGGAGDVLARILGARLTEITGAQHVVDNRGGSGGLIGTDITAKSAGNGYTQLLHSAGISYEPALRDKLPYDTLRDLAAITLIGSTPNVLVVHPAFSARTARELIALAKQKPGAVTFGSGGVGSSSHLAVALFQSLAGARFNHIPYKGAGPALGEVIAGQIGFMIATAPGALPHVKSGRLIALGVSSVTRAAALPETPTIAESGLPGYDYVAWFGVFAAGATPRALVARMDALYKQAIADAETRAKLEIAGITPQPTTPEKFQGMLRDEIAKWQKIIAAAGIKAS
jgi:tripartite-type tricarboxylate transporter receptor subunit TctC